MKNLCILLLFVFHFSYAQKEGNMWYFGQNAGLNFNSGTPVPFTGSAMNTLEGCASVSDSAGNTLFYTSGITVWNRSNLQMPNGSGLGGDNNSAQSAIIIKAPGSSYLYYIFTTPTNGNLPLRYSMVDMTLMGGLGNVTVKNTLLFNNSTEKVTAVYHSNGTDIWVIGHEHNSNRFFSYLITSSGVSSAPVISSSGTAHNGSPLPFAGYMKGSHDGRKLACAVTVNMNFVELFDFDNTTGLVSNPITFNNIQSAYGIEFSPDDSKLYATEENPKNIIQWDLNAGSSAAIIASKTTVATSATECATLQLGPDSKIYLARRFSNQMGVIQNPNQAGIACNYLDNALTLSSGTTNRYGLPNFFQGIFRLSVTPKAHFVTTDTAVCPGACISFSNLSVQATSYDWSFPGATPSSDTGSAPTQICYSYPGRYDVQLIAINGNNRDTLLMADYIWVQPLPHAGSVAAEPDTLCSGASSQLEVTGSVGAIQWQISDDGLSFADLPDDTLPAYTTSALSQTTYYRLKATASCGVDSSAPVLLLVNPLPTPFISTTDTLICSGDSTLICTSNAFANYLWNTNDTVSCVNASLAGAYWLTVTDGNGCSAISNRQNISVYPIPSVSVIVQGDTLSSFGAVSYQWYFNGALIPGATGAIHIAEASGDYSLEISDANGCTARSNPFSVIVSGIEKTKNDFGFQVYPNPFNDYFFIQSSQPVPELERIEVYDMLGRMVFRNNEKHPSNRLLIHTSAWSPGVYHVRIITTTGESGWQLIR